MPSFTMPVMFAALPPEETTLMEMSVFEPI